MIDLTGTLITIATGLHALLQRLFRKHVSFPKIMSNNTKVKKVLETFKKNMKSEYGNHIYSLDEISHKQALILENCKFIDLTESELDYIKVYVYRAIEHHNETVKSFLGYDAKTILENQKSDAQEIKSTLTNLINKDVKEKKRKFLKAVENSKNISLNNIDDKINNEYEIDRSALIEKIKDDNKKFICISGNAGVGKSALCKKLLYGEKYVLYARAERVSSSRNVNDVWDCEIEECVKDIKTKKIYFFIDALEYIADVQSITSKIELLQVLFDVAQKQENIYVVTTCRTSDISAFVKLFANYKVQSYEIEGLSEGEIDGVCNRYPLIKELSKSNKYSVLLKNPLYISIILSNFNSIADVSNECDLRNKIWNDIICLRNKASDYGLKLSKIRETIEEIVFVRAKEFRLGVNKNDLDDEVLKKLESECIITINGDLVRLKHDLFEDICFEIKFDRLFDDCNGDYSSFFTSINDFGRCAYRRYQIWISNKIFAKDSREKFLHQLVFCQQSNECWHDQTIIGIVKSDYCRDFFFEYYSILLTSGLLLDFIRIINLYAFNAKPLKTEAGYHFLQLVPAGKAREHIISLISSNHSYGIDIESIVKLCDDYSKSENKDLEISKAACDILEFYVAEKRKDKSEYWGMDIPRAIKPLLSAIYKMSDASKDWIITFLNEQIIHLKSDNREERNFSEEILEWTIKECDLALIKELPDEMCYLAKKLWMSFDYKPEDDFYANEKKFGLSHFASDRNFSLGFSDKQNATSRNLFFSFLLTQHLLKALDWAIDFLNESIAYYASVKPDEIQNVEVVFLETNKRKEYLGNTKLWICASHEYEIPLLLSDIIYWLKNFVINSLEILKNQSDDSFLKLANVVRLKIYGQSNNVALLSIINYIGLHFEKELPGYALDLGTSLDLIWWDFNRILLYHESNATKVLKVQMSQILLGQVYLPSRYELDKKCTQSLQDYVRNLQLKNDKKLKQQSETVIDYLFSISKKYGNDPQKNLLIQQMDLRKAKVKKINENHIVLTPYVGGESQKMVEEQIEKDAPLSRFHQMFAECIQNESKKDYDLINKTIDYALKQAEKDEPFRIETEKDTLDLVIVALLDKNLSQERKAFLCQFWIDGIRKILNNGTFITDNKNIIILWAQLKMDVPNATKNAIKKLMLDILMYPYPNGMVNKLAKTIKLFLKSEKCQNVSRAFFNTILMQAKSKMVHQKYKTQYLERQNYVYIISNDKLQDFFLRVYKKQNYEIIQRYLYEEESLEITNFNIGDYEIDVLCFIANCGLDFNDSLFAMIIKDVLKHEVRILGQPQKYNNEENKLTSRQIREMEELLQWEVVEKNTDGFLAIDLIFDDVEIPEHHQKIIEFYLSFLGFIQCAYIDNINKPQKIREIENKIQYLEKKIEELSSDSFKEALYKVLCFCVESCYVPDPKKFKVNYPYANKIFINNQIKKYGKYDVEEMFRGLYNLNVEQLLPEILDAINVSLKGNEKGAMSAGNLKDVMHIINMIVTTAFIEHSDKIKKDSNLTDAYEEILETLVGIGNEQAAWLLDEFRLH